MKKNVTLSAEALNEFINKSAKEYGFTREEYLDSVAKNNYVVVKDGEAIAWDEEDLMVLDTIEGALDESEADEKVMSESEYYKMKKVI